jgi:5-methylcytosine-specific restriction endonuclease McrA
MAKRRKFSQEDRELVARRANGICEYCQMPENFNTDTFEMEHITALVHNGTNDLGNIAFSCSGCNGRKGIKRTASDPITWVEVPLYHPRNDNWEDHFQWTDDFLRLVGISPTGRATIEAFGTHPRIR